MQFWEEIINTALLGTDKRAVSAAQLPEGLAGVAERIAGAASDKEEQFLQLAAVAFNYRQSGVVPLQQEGIELPLALPEELPYCSGRAVQLLKEIMEDDLTALLDYWMKTCIRMRKIVVPDMLPVLLNRSVNHVSMQLLVGAVCGKRGEWIRAFNPSWQFGGVGSDEEVWETGTGAQRAAVLRRWRLEDPAKAREMVARTWAEENANGKVELLRQLNGTLDAADKQWLEGLSGEKSQKVKEEVAGLLAQAERYELFKLKDASSIAQVPADCWVGEWTMDMTRAVLKHTARQPYQFPVSYYKERVVQLAPGIVAELDKFAPPEPHLKAMWDKLSEQIKRLLSLREQVSKAFN